MKYTKELLQVAVDNNVSYAGVLRSLGLKQSGGSQSHLKRRIENFELDTSHFLGKGTNRGPKHKGGKPIKSVNDRLALGSCTDNRVKGYILKKALLSTGIEEICVKCGQLPVWLGKRLVLTPDHKNGRFWDNRKENLELLCPNCHSQTSTYCGKKRLDV